MNKKIPFPIAIIIIVTLAVLVGGIAVWQYLGMPEIKLPEFKPSGKIQLEDETADWKTYRNEKAGFEIKYPPDWIFYEEIGAYWNKDAVLLTFCGPKHSTLCRTVGLSSSDSVISLRNDTLDITKEDFCNEEGNNTIFCVKERILSHNNIIINGREGEIFEIDTFGGSLVTVWKKNHSDSTMYEMSLEHSKVHPEYQNIFNQMLSTFRFLD